MKRSLRVAAAVPVLVLLAGARPAQAQDRERALLDAVGIEQRIGARLPLDARFVDETGREIALGDLFGRRPVVLALVYYECPMLCNLVLNGLVAALKGVALRPGEDFEVVAVSIDPEETPELARAKRDGYAARLGGRAAEGMHFLVGAEDAIQRTSKAVGFRYAYDPAEDEYAHAAAIVVATPEGDLARYFYGVEYAPRDVRLALVEASSGRLGTVVDQVLLLCFHYDPARGRYGLAILNAIRLGGGLTVLLLLGFVGKHLAGDRRRAAAGEAH